MKNEQLVWQEFSKLHGCTSKEDLSIQFLNDLWTEWNAAWKACEAQQLSGWKEIETVPDTTKKFLVSDSITGELVLVTGFVARRERNADGSMKYAGWMDVERPTVKVNNQILREM